MPDINFLPKEDRPKHPPAPNREKIAVEFYRPEAEKNNLKQPAPKSNWPNKIGGIFKSLFNKAKNDNSAPRDLSAAFGRAGLDLKSNRENLLKQIKSGSAAPAKKELNMNLAAGVAVNGRHKNSFLRGLMSYGKAWRFILNWLKLRFKIKKLPPKVIKLTPANVQPNPEPKRAFEPPAAPLASAPETKTNANRENSLETNLIKGNEFIFFNWRLAGWINIIAVVFSLAVIGGGWGYLVWLESQRAVFSEIDEKLSAKAEQQQKLTEETDKLSDLRAKTAAVKKLLAKHIYWTNFFNWLEKNTLAGVYYENFAGDAAGGYVLPALARDFKTFGAQLKAWQEEKIFAISAKTTKAEVKTQRNYAEQTGIGEQNVSFDVNLTVKPEIFNK